MDLKTHCKGKIIEPEHLTNKVAHLRSLGKKIATLNGSFDLLHAGHLYILYEGAAQADCLFVLLNSDNSIRSYKSPERPIIPLSYRIEMMASLACVDFVSWFEEDDPRKILQVIQPDVHINGAEYGEECIEAKVVKENGGRLHLVSRIDGLSTSQIVDKIKKLS